MEKKNIKKNGNCPSAKSRTKEALNITMAFSCIITIREYCLNKKLTRVMLLQISHPTLQYKQINNNYMMITMMI